MSQNVIQNTLIRYVPVEGMPPWSGGMLRKDGTRKPSLGGVFLELCQQRRTQAERRKIFREPVSRPGMSIAVIAGNLAFPPFLAVPLTSVLSTQLFTL